jgi:hypothetical protein
MFGREVVWAWIVSRVVAAAALTTGNSIAHGRVDGHALTGWDGRWFLAIAEHGYGHGRPAHWFLHETPWPFFPLLPGLARMLMLAGVPAPVGIVLINNVAFLVALAGVYRLVSRQLTSGVAAWAVWALALWPGSVTSVMGYSGGLFLAGSVWAFTLVDEDSFALAGGAALIAVAARPNGALVLVALVPATIDAARQVGSWRRPVLSVTVPSALFLLGWCAWLHLVSGDPLVFIHAKAAWFEMTVVDFLRRPNLTSQVHMILFATAVAAVIWSRRRLPVSWKVLVVVSLAPSLLLGVVGLGRYAAECFPVAVALAVILFRSPGWFRVFYMTVSAGGLIAVGVLSGQGHLVP